MQLYLNATSPFARLARVVALEKGLGNQLELVWCDPWSNDPTLLAQHPQGRIPVLHTDDGQTIAESLLIALYLDSLAPSPALVPLHCRSAILAQTSIAYGIMETAFHIVIAHKYEGAGANESFMGQRRWAALLRSLAQVEIEMQLKIDENILWHLGQLSLAVALDYVQFRLPQALEADALAHCRQWCTRAMQRESLKTTAFN